MLGPSDGGHEGLPTLSVPEQTQECLSFLWRFSVARGCCECVQKVWALRKTGQLRILVLQGKTCLRDEGGMGLWLWVAF